MFPVHPASKATLSLCAASLLLPLAASAEWSQPLGVNGNNRAERPALITGAGATTPGFSWTVQKASERLDEAILRDLDGNGEPEVVFVASGRVFALDPQLGGPSWASPAQGLDGILGFAELDGNLTSPELVASSATTSGGFLLLDPSFGGLLGTVGGFPQLSGADRIESSIYDLDGDGIDEIVHPAGRYGLGDLYISTFVDGPASPGFLSASFSGYSNLTPAMVGDLLGTGAGAVAIDQGAEWTLFPTCAPSAPGAVCDDGAGTICLCASSKFYGMNATYVFGPRWVVNADSDPQDEIVAVGNWPLYIKAIAVFDMAAGLASGSPDSPSARQWYRRYMATSPTADIEALPDGPVDLDGDGSLEIIASFFNNDGSDADATGTIPFEDGIDNPGGVSVGVFDLATGTLLASLDDAFAWGTADLDADGDLELVTSPTTGFAFDTGLSGYEMTCVGVACTLSPVWDAPNRTLNRQLPSFEGLDLPPPGLHTLDTDGDGIGELLAYQGTTLQALLADGAGGVTVPGSRLLLPDEELIGSDAATNTALLTGSEEVTVLNAGLGTLGGPIPLPSRGWERMQAASFDGGPREAAVFSDGVFVTEASPSDLSQADFELLPSFGLAADLDGDGAAEVVSYANPGSLELDDDSFEIRLDRWNDVTGASETVWEFDSSSSATYDGFTVGSSLHIASGNFDGTGSEDIVVEVSGSGVYLYLVLDGDTGAVDATLTPTELVSSAGILYVADLVNGSGTAGADGIDDLVISGANRLGLLTVAGGELWTSTPGSFIHGVSAFADTDADGDDELITTLSVSVANQIEVIDDIETSSPSASWGPVALPLPTDQLQVLGVAELDGVAGDDVVYITADGGVHGFVGDTGADITGLPLYVGNGAAATSPIAGASNPLSLLILDVDDDGFEEAIVGTTDGIIYALNVSAEEGAAAALLWSFDAGSAVRALGAADTDGDGYDEILVSTDDGNGSVLDGIGVDVQIIVPTLGACIPSTEFTVSGSAVGLTSVEIFLAGASISGDVDASSGSWSGLAEARGGGLFTLEVQGKDANGTVAAYDSVLVLVGADDDRDGWFSCADCDETDADINPGAEDVCEDGIDQDCDGDDAECGDDDDSTSDDDDSTSDDDDSTSDDDDSTGDDDDSTGDDDDAAGGCDGCSSAPSQGSGLAMLGFLFGLGVLRRRPGREAAGGAR